MSINEAQLLLAADAVYERRYPLSIGQDFATRVDCVSSPARIVLNRASCAPRELHFKRSAALCRGA